MQMIEIFGSELEQIMDISSTNNQIKLKTYIILKTYNIFQHQK